MNLSKGEFITEDEGDSFIIEITQESNWSQDGGYTFENVSNSFALNKYDARHLRDELNLFIKKQVF